MDELVPGANSPAPSGELRVPGGLAAPAGSPRQRVLFVETNEDGTAGGSYHCLLDIARTLDAKRFVPVALFYQPNVYADRLRALGVEVHCWADVRASEKRPPRGSWRTLRQIGHWTTRIGARARFLRRAGIDLVHLNNSPGTGYADWLPAARLARVPCLTHARGYDAWPRRPLWRRLMRSYDRVIAISETMRRDLLASTMPAERIELLHDGIDGDAVRAAALRRRSTDVREDLQVPLGGWLVVMVGHLRPWKGQREALEGIARLPAATRRLLVVALVGDTPSADREYAAELRVRAAEPDLAGIVRFLGPRADVPTLMRAADIVLHASTTPEPLGLVVLEGMALGKPVLASAYGGPTEVVTPDSGVLVRPEDPDALAAEIQGLLGAPSRRLALGEGARRRADDFDLTRQVRRLEAIYDECLAGHRVGSLVSFIGTLLSLSS